MPIKRYVEQTDRNRYYYFDDFGGGNFDNLTWGYGGTAGGSVAKISAVGGQIRVTVGGTAGNEYYIVQDTRRNFNVSGPCEVTWRVKIEDITNVSVQLGLATDSTHYIEFFADSASSANWLAASRNGASSSSTDTGWRVDANVWVKLQILANSSEVKFFIDNSLRVTMSTVANIPTGDQGPIVYMYRNTGGSGTRSALVDYCEAIGGRP